ncbi:hypothetical protein SpAn4DRAFT_1925 [Sporomusa ovata]|uniref:Uncharacterized protein n=1 Tax=Sporomusa ovata TaxID=2378 RepID=A0A0U1KU70_9FIRM|nr:hypothetical protein SpAn4DRAFT_1925 [Sporomusa ovata]
MCGGMIESLEFSAETSFIAKIWSFLKNIRQMHCFLLLLMSEK